MAVLLFGIVGMLMLMLVALMIWGTREGKKRIDTLLGGWQAAAKELGLGITAPQDYRGWTPAERVERLASRRCAVSAASQARALGVLA